MTREQKDFYLESVAKGDSGQGPLLQKHVMSNFCPPLGSIIDEESKEYDFLDLMGVKNG